MKNTYEEIVRDIKELKALKPEDHHKKKEELKALEDRHTSIRKEIKQSHKKLNEAKTKIEEVKAYYKSTQNDRQGLLAASKDVTEITATMNSLKDQEELLKDTIAGLERKIEELNKQEAQAEQDMSGVKQSMLRLKLIPLVDEYNEAAEKLARILEQVYDITYELNEPTHISQSGRRTVILSEDIGIIPKMYLAGFVPQEAYVIRGTGRMKHHYNDYLMKQEKQKQRNGAKENA